MRIRCSLTVKQMKLISIITLIIVLPFAIMQLFYILQQKKNDIYYQLENIAIFINTNIDSAIQHNDLTLIKTTIAQANSTKILSHVVINVYTPKQYHHYDLITSPTSHTFLIDQLAGLPIQKTFPILNQQRQTIGQLTLSVDPTLTRHSLLESLSMFIISYIFIVFLLSIAISWSLNRLITYPLRAINQHLDKITEHPQKLTILPLPKKHKNDELGYLIRKINAYQKKLNALLKWK